MISLVLFAAFCFMMIYILRIHVKVNAEFDRQIRGQKKTDLEKKAIKRKLLGSFLKRAFLAMLMFILFSLLLLILKLKEYI